LHFFFRTTELAQTSELASKTVCSHPIFTENLVEQESAHFRVEKSDARNTLRTIKPVSSERGHHEPKKGHAHTPAQNGGDASAPQRQNGGRYFFLDCPKKRAPAKQTKATTMIN